METYCLLHIKYRVRQSVSMYNHLNRTYLIWRIIANRFRFDFFHSAVPSFPPSAFPPLLLSISLPLSTLVSVYRIRFVFDWLHWWWATVHAKTYKYLFIVSVRVDGRNWSQQLFANVRMWYTRYTMQSEIHPIPYFIIITLMLMFNFEYIHVVV